ncbi:glycosyltransferase family 9 protein [Pelomicrobium sp.]|uniref:glycosyltransferase family 9 protein n=1 Tax=Pelomicrobium sp. TaxID=2815319 RepID=UPI002FDD5AB1
MNATLERRAPAMPPRHVLVIVTRRIGDVLLATPLIRSLKRAWPEARVDALVFQGTEGGLAANPDIHRIHTVAERPGAVEHARFYAALLRRYDIALSVLTGDRPTLYAFAAGRWRAGLLNPRPKEAWKQRLLHRWIPFDDLETHTVRMNLRLAELLGIPPIAEVVVGWSPRDQALVQALTLGTRPGHYAVLHPYPKFNYKKWYPAGWRQLAAWLDRQGLRIVLTGGAGAEERAYVAAVAERLPGGALNLAGRVSLAMLGPLLAGAAVYVGPDTAITHMAAAVGTPTVALFGPSNPVKWGPWPKGHPADQNPWQRIGSQRAGNVFLLQGRKHCVPCMLEGCERHVQSYSDCLQELPASRVIEAVQTLLAERPMPVGF